MPADWLIKEADQGMEDTTKPRCICLCRSSTTLLEAGTSPQVSATSARGSSEALLCLWSSAWPTMWSMRPR